MTASHFCDPAWHNRDIVDADFMIKPLSEERGPFISSFAACEEHVSKALNIMLSKYKTVQVYRVPPG